MAIDLAERAGRRAGFAALAGTLLLSEPGDSVASFVSQVPGLEALADSSLSVEFERIFLRSVPPYESVFRSDSAERGGAAAARVADFFDDIGFDEHRTNRWRVAGPDHLGLLVRAHAFVVGLEAAAWRGERPDEAARHVETQRRLFAEHLGWWGQMCLDALGVAATVSVPASPATPYGSFIHAVGEFLSEEVDALRPLPLLDASQLDTGSAPRKLGPRRLARHILSPARCGFWLGAESIAASAHSLGFPWRPMDGRGNLVPLVSAAFDAGELPALVAPWAQLSARAAEAHGKRAVAEPGSELVWRHHQSLAVATTQLLEGIVDSGSAADDDEEIVMRVAGSGAHRAIDILRSQGFDAEIVGE